MNIRYRTIYAEGRSSCENNGLIIHSGEGEGILTEGHTFGLQITVIVLVKNGKGAKLHVRVYKTHIAQIGLA